MEYKSKFYKVVPCYDPNGDPELMIDERDICVGCNLYEYLHPSASAVGTCGNEQGEDK